MLRRMVLGTMVAGLLLASSASASWASDWFNVLCPKGTSNPGCTTSAGTTKETGGQQSRRKKSSGKASQAGARVCKDIIGQVIPCSDPYFGEVGSDGCYYKATTVTPAQAAAFGGAGKGPGGWFDQVCMGVPGTAGGFVWRPAGAAGTPAAPPPRVVALQARDRLDLSAPVIGASPSPDVEQLVSLPTWLWVEGAWQPQSATATVPGVSVTATATPTKVTWAMGDGSKVVCPGPGTPFPDVDDPNADPKAASPDCGHTYAESSAGQPNAAFAVKATISWSITWKLNGQGPAQNLPGLQTTSQTQFRVAESQALASSARTGTG